jgi:hypothetical protein
MQGTEIHWTQNISEPELRHSKRGWEHEKGNGEARRRMSYGLSVFPSLPVPRYVNVDVSRKS